MLLWATRPRRDVRQKRREIDTRWRGNPVNQMPHRQTDYGIWRLLAGRAAQRWYDYVPLPPVSTRSWFRGPRGATTRRLVDDFDPASIVFIPRAPGIVARASVWFY